MSKQSTPWYSIRRHTGIAAAAAAVLAGAGAVSASAEILIYGDIGESWWEETVSARQFVADIAAFDVDAITVRINSIGGSVPDGIAIYNAIRRHKATVTTINDGMALSIASLILMAGDNVEMAENAMLMIHAPWTYAAGNSAQLREMADQLDKWAEAMATSYAARTGRPHEEMLAMLLDGKDHYLTAAEALEQKFVTSVTTAVPPAAMAMAGADRFRALSAARAAATATPAAPAASTPENIPMPQAQNPAGTTTSAPTDPQAIAAAALAADKARREAIAASFKPFAERDGVQALLQQCQDDHKCDVQAAGQKLLAKLAEGAVPLAGRHVTTVEDEADKRFKATAQALAARAGLEKLDTANPVRGETLYDMARASLARAGFKTDGLDKMAIVAASFTHSTSDFKNLLANVANKSMLKGVDEAEETFQLWTSRGELTDFREAKRVSVNSFGSLPKVAEGGEYTFGSMGDRGQAAILAKYGRRFAITREAIINDDLSAFTKIPRAMGRAAIRTVGDLVYAVLTGNPVMDEDGKALFHADHNNLLTGGAITTDNVDAMRVAMARQKTPGLTTGGSNIRLAYLLVPVALGGKASVVRDSEYEVGAASRNNTVPNSVRGLFEVISDARLDDSSATAWYGAANGSVNDTVEVSYLNGNDRPTLEQQDGWSVDGTEFKVRMEAAATPLDFRGLAKNPGA